MRHLRAFSGLPNFWRLIDQPLSIQFLVAGGMITVSLLSGVGVILYQVQNQTNAFESSEQIRASIDRLEALSNLSLSQRAANFKSQKRLLDYHRSRERQQTTVIFITIALINIFLILILGLVLRRLYTSIAGPLLSLLGAIEKYQDGSFSTRVTVTNRGMVGYMEASFNEMAEKIETMVKDLRKLDEMKSEFISTASHELRTPLTSIGGYVKLLLAGDVGELTELQTDFLKIVDMNVIRLNTLISEILDVESLEDGKLEVIREPQDLVSVLKECIDTFKVMAQQKGLQVRYSVPDSLKPVLGDRVRFVQIFMNLISNAIKYTSHGFIEVSAEQSEFAITIRIRDSGVGLNAEEQERLFQKFYRARSSLTSAESGSGLGLVIVRRLVELFSGKIVVESQPGEGSQFTVTFPCLQPSASGFSDARKDLALLAVSPLEPTLTSSRKEK